MTLRVSKTLAMAAVMLALAGCRLYDPQGRPPPGENFNAGSGFGVPSQPRQTVDLSGTRGVFTGGQTAMDSLAGLSDTQRGGLLAGCDLLFGRQPDKRRDCKGGDYAFTEALQAGCAERYRDDADRRRECLAPLAD